MIAARPCSARNCNRAAPGAWNDFCPSHHFMLPKALTTVIRKLRIECANTSDDGVKAHCEEQIAGYLAEARRKLSGGAAA